MRHLYLSLTAQGPLSIRSDHATGGAATARHIPGSTLRGGLAAAHHMLHPRQDDVFSRLFLEEKVFFPHLYPASFQSSDEELNTLNWPVKPLPKTAQECKRFSGFQPLPGENAEERHGIRDSLLDWTIFSLLDAQNALLPELLATLKHQATCSFSGCLRPLDHADGYYRCSYNDPKRRMISKRLARLQTRTGINRDWGVVEEGVLYNREVFEDGMSFWGELLFPDEEDLPEEKRVITLFQQLMQEANAEMPGLIRIGTGRTRGLGSVYVDLPHDLVEVEREALPTFQQRLVDFNTTLQEEAREMGVGKMDPFYFAITLSSPAILCDPFLRHQKTLDGATLGGLLQRSTTTFKQIYQATSIQSIIGWNDLWGTPRARDYALEVGSTFVFASTVEPDTRLLQALYTLEETGIGRRRAEGFGRICISDPFHLERKQL